VSPWWTDTLHVHCGPEGALALSRKGWRRRFGEARQYVGTSDGERWSAAVDGLASALAEFQCRQVKVVVSNRLVQYRKLAWRDDLLGDDEYLTLARLEFADAFGALADGWQIVLSDEEPGRARMAAAIPGEFIAAIKAAAAQHHSHLLGVQPALAVAARVGLPADSDTPHCLVVAEPGQLCFAVRQATDWQWVRQVRVTDEWAAELPQLLDDESRLANIDLSPQTTRVYAPDASGEMQAALGSQGFSMVDAATSAGFPFGADPRLVTAWGA
jgi:hypothetical protein